MNIALKASLGTLVLLLGISQTAIVPAAETKNEASQALEKLLDDDWQWRMDNYPTWATYLGDRRGLDRWEDMSREAIDKRKEHPHELLRRLKEINREELPPDDQLNYDLFLYEVKLNIEGQAFPTELLAVDQLNGPQLELGQVAEVMPLATVADYEAYIQRLRGFQPYLGQLTDLLKEGIKRRWVQPAEQLRGIGSQIQGQLFAQAEDSPLFKPAKKFPESFSEEDRARLEKELTAAIREAVFPALIDFREFLEKKYLPGGAETIGAVGLPDGRKYYQYRIRRSTTVDLTAQEIHDIGLSEVKRIRAEMEKVIKDSGFEGDFKAFLEFIQNDPQFYYDDAEELLKGYRDIAKRADAQLPPLFATLPRLPYGVRAFPDYEAPNQAGARYYRGAADGSRPGYFMANTYKLDSRPKYEMEALTLHEAVPGHHLQIARAQELEGLPNFRRYGGNTAYIEGWALYAESLGEEMGFYADPYSKFGQLTYEMWRACRLVIDTGIHSLGWSREQAIRFFRENSGKSDLEIAVEVDRYIVWPGQALAYKIGELQIKALRKEAEQKLGEKFNIRLFHNALLDQGALPLPVLEREIQEWIKTQE